MSETSMEKIVSLCKRRGFIFPGSEIYGGLKNTWDYGPYGVELKNNLKKYWWQSFVTEREDIVGLDAAILMNPKVWEASGHVTCFSDPLIDCKNCRERFRGDKLVEEKSQKSYPELAREHIDPWIDAGGNEVQEKLMNKISAYHREEALELIPLLKNDQSKFLMRALPALLRFHEIACPKCGKKEFTEPRSFNLMFKTHQGVIEGSGAEIYLRPETAQGIFVNFKNVLNVSRKKLPFGIAQIGKAFRNEITPGNFTFRTREFEQMEIEYFIKPGSENEHFEKWCQQSMNWFLSLGLSKEKLRFRAHTREELSHYSSMTRDIEYHFPFGWGELEGVACRSDYDLMQHQKFSGDELKYLDPESHQKFVPHVIEPSFGADRTVLTILIDAYAEETVGDETRVVMRFHPQIAPVKVAVLPLSHKLENEARSVFQKIKKLWSSEFDLTGSIGKRYRRQDEIGTPLCITYDFESPQDDSVTIRERDSMKQERIKISALENALKEKLSL